MTHRDTETQDAINSLSMAIVDDIASVVADISEKHGERGEVVLLEVLRAMLWFTAEHFVHVSLDELLSMLASGVRERLL